MSTRKLVVLGTVAVVAVVAALWSSQTRRPSQDEGTMQPLVPALATGGNDVSEVRVLGAEGRTLVTLKRGESGWSVAERGGYDANVEQLREYLLKLSQAKRVEAKTSSPELYDRLGVEEIEAKEAYGAQLELDGLQPPVKLIIGRNVTRGEGTYVRFAGDPQSWEASADLGVEKLPANWLQKDLVDIAAGRIERVTVTPPTGAKIEIARAPEGSAGDFVVANLPKGREAASDYVADATAGLLAALRLDDVVPASESELPESGVRRAQFHSEDGVVVGIESWLVDGRTHARFSASLDEARAATFVAEAQERAAREHAAMANAATPQVEAAGGDGAATDGKSATAKTDTGAEPDADGNAPVDVTSAPLAVTDPEADRAARLQALQSEVERLGAKFEGWTFVLPPYKADNLNKDLEGYLKPKE